MDFVNPNAMTGCVRLNTLSTPGVYSVFRFSTNTKGRRELYLIEQGANYNTMSMVHTYVGEARSTGNST